ncbi:MAG: FG-GAP-like repeat-containing protein, partial [Acidimicrobiales bacterium]
MVRSSSGSSFRRAVAAIGAMLAVVTIVALGLPAQTAGAATPSALPDLQCGVPVTTSVKLRADLTCLESLHIPRNAPPLTIDLGGHTLTGPQSCGSQSGALCAVESESGVATITDGTVDGGISGMRISRVHVTGIVTTGMTGAVIVSHSVIDHGVYQWGSASIHDNRIGGGIFYDDDFIGTGFSIVGNTIVGGAGISVYDEFDFDHIGGTISGNDISGSSGAGITIRGPGTYVMRPVTIANNTVHDNAGDGIDVSVTSSQYSYAAPGAVNGPIELRGNVARRNGGHGIDAHFERDGGSAPGVIDRGANRASGNGVVPQCIGVRCGPTDTRLIPDVTWRNPAISDTPPYGDPLSAAQLNATSPVPGTFTYSPAAGAIPLAGATALRVHFVPDDLVRYQPTDRTVELLVPPPPRVTPTLTWPSPADIVFGTPLGSEQLDATAPVPGTFTYTPAAGTVLDVGTHQLRVRFVPDDLLLYFPTELTTTVTVLAPATESVAWSDPAPIPYGTPIGPTQLNAVASVPGTFAYHPGAGTVLMPGPHALVADFTPDDTTSYSPIQTVVQIEVQPPVAPPPTATFAPALDLPRGGFDAPIDVDLADVNGDGALDAITAMPGIAGPGSVRISFGAGDGSFPTSTDLIIPLIGGGHTLAAGDVDGDGHVDLVASNGATSTISVLLGHGDGTFAAAVVRPAGNGQGDIQLVDLDGDGHLDVVESNYVGGTVSVLLGHGDGTFADGIDTRAGALPVKLAAADLNGDGHLDLVVPDALTDIVSVLLGNGDGTFQPRRAIPVGLSPTSVAAADLDGDGHLDLAVTNSGDSTLSVLEGDGTGAFGSRLDYSSAAGPRAVRAGDMNGDGIADLVTANESGTIGVWLGVG